MDIKKKTLKLFFIEGLILFALLLVFGSLQFITPFYGDLNLIDEGQLAAWANHMLLGKKMYKDIYIPYGPLLVYPLYLLFELFGPNAFLVRVYVTLQVFISILSINLLLYIYNLKTLTRRILLVLLFMIPGLTLRQGGGFIVIAFTSLFLIKKRMVYYFFAGFFSIVSFLISPDIGMFSILLLMIVSLIQLIRCKDIKVELAKVLLLVFGLLLSLEFFYLWAISESWFNSYKQVMLDALISFLGINTPNGKNFPYFDQLLSSNFSVWDLIRFGLSKDGYLYWLLIFYISTFFYLFARFVLRILNKKDLLITLLLFYGSSLYTVVIGRPGHLLFVVQPVIIISVLFIENLLKLLKTENNKKSLFAYILIAIILVFNLRLVAMYRTGINSLMSILTASADKHSYVSRVGVVKISSFQKKYISTIQNFVDKNTSIKDSVFFLSDEPMMYMLINRVNPTRYDLPFMANIKEKRSELINDLQKKKPKYIFYDTSSWAVDEVNNFIRIPEINSLLDSTYKTEKQINGIKIYRINK